MLLKLPSVLLRNKLFFDIIEIYSMVSDSNYSNYRTIEIRVIIIAVGTCTHFAFSNVCIVWDSAPNTVM